MAECKNVIPGVDLKDLEFPKRDAGDVLNFIKHYRKRLKKSQIDLLKLFADKIYGFHMSTHEYLDKELRFPVSDKHSDTVVFKFEHDGAEGKITIRF